MNHRPLRRAATGFAAAGIALAALGGCRVYEYDEPPPRHERPVERETVIVHEAPPPVVEERVVYIHDAPPEPRREVVIERERPSTRHVWVGGCWRHDGRAYVWVAGHWDLPPRGMSVWVAPHYERRGGGYVMIEGFWR